MAAAAPSLMGEHMGSVSGQAITDGVLMTGEKPVPQVASPTHEGWVEGIEAPGYDPEKAKALLAEAGREVERAVAAYEAITPQAPETLLDYQFAELPKAYLAQRQRIIAKGMLQSGEGL